MLYFYTRDLKPMIDNPAENKDVIADILKQASKTMSDEDLGKIYDNPFNDEFRMFANIRGIRQEAGNKLWAAACLMLGIEELKTESNIALSFKYLQMAVDYDYAPGASRLGWYYTLKVAPTEADYKEAIKWFKKVIACGSNYASPWNSLGHCYENLGDKKEAEKCFKETLKIDPENVTAKRHLAEYAEAANAVSQKRKREEDEDAPTAIVNEPAPSAPKKHKSKHKEKASVNLENLTHLFLINSTTQKSNHQSNHQKSEIEKGNNAESAPKLTRSRSW
jgi:tetratricopeptide (TPR) repeat protein